MLNRKFNMIRRGPLIPKFGLLIVLIFFVDVSKSWFSDFPTSQTPLVSHEEDWLGIEDCLCQVSGSLGDCSCDVESIDSYNSRLIYPSLRELTYRDYFRFFKVNLKKPCEFWEDEGHCVLRDCAVQACSVEQLPPHLVKNLDDSQVTAKNPDTESEKETPREACSPQSDESEREKAEAEALGSVDGTIADQMLKEFEVWEKHDELSENFCYLENETDPDAVYVDLSLNPERFTGYSGPSTHRVWSSIYKENCFKSEPTRVGYGSAEKQKFAEILNSYTMGDVCTEKRVFYRLISGLHASITVHLAAKYLLKNPFGELRFGHNLTEFRQRFDPALTYNQGPHRLKNIYFLYLVEMKAILKATPILSQLKFFTNVEETDTETKDLIMSLLDHIAKFPNHFDEHTLFREKEVQSLKEVYKTQFRNISRIMDCVGCNKCKLWGKIQTQGLGTALKILFSGIPNENKAIKLSRTEIVALFNAFAQLSESIWHIEEFKQLAKDHKRSSNLRTEF